MSGRKKRWPWTRRRTISLTVFVTVCAALAGIAVAAADDAVIYYRTPTEAAQMSADEGVMRVGGMVVSGSIVESEEQSTLLLTDGVTRMEVRYDGRLPDALREGEGAVVEGRWAPDGAMRASQLLFKHSNEYRAPDAGSP